MTVMTNNVSTSVGVLTSFFCTGARVPEQQVRADRSPPGAAGGALPLWSRLQPALAGRKRPRVPAVRATVQDDPGRSSLPTDRRWRAGAFRLRFFYAASIAATFRRPMIA